MRTKEEIKKTIDYYKDLISVIESNRDLKVRKNLNKIESIKSEANRKIEYLNSSIKYQEAKLTKE